jgi:cellulose synthase/poly-beta-1,6-N-acetylglucosamine synthase-like glycosyltransferase
MQFVQVNRKKNQRQRWQRFWPKTLLVLIAFLQMLLTGAILALEFCSMISNIKYSFFFIGFIASVFYIITWISTFIVGKDLKY